MSKSETKVCPEYERRIAVKIIDMLGEEVIIVKEI